jgi:THO complex subunit 1 transcription elongation factor
MLEGAQLIQKKDILNAFSELFESSQEQHLLSLFQLMERKIFHQEETKSSFMVTGVTEKDANTLINLCAKICKMIMRKLSATHDTEFRGRVQKLIASVFPLTHPSGLNKPGNFNLKNVT